MISNPFCYKYFIICLAVSGMALSSFLNLKHIIARINTCVNVRVVLYQFPVISLSREENYHSCQYIAFRAKTIAIFGKNWYTLGNSNKMGVNSHEERYNPFSRNRSAFLGKQFGSQKVTYNTRAQLA